MAKLAVSVSCKFLQDLCDFKVAGTVNVLGQYVLSDPLCAPGEWRAVQRWVPGDMKSTTPYISLRAYLGVDLL